MPTWPFKGKHQGKNVNDIPTDYFEWAVRDSKNPEARDMAQRVLDFRGGGGQKSSQRSSDRTSPRRYTNQQAVSQDFLSMMTRGLALWLHTQTGYPLEHVQEYLRSGNTPWNVKEQEPAPELTDPKFDPFEKERGGNDWDYDEETGEKIPY